MEKNTYAFNVRFTRPDENDANIYYIGTNVMATDLATAREILAAREAHLTVLDIELVHMFDVDGNDCELPKGGR